MVPTSASGSAETMMGTCHPKTGHLLVAHCAHHLHGHSHMGNAIPSLRSGMMAPSPHCTPGAQSHPQQGLGVPAWSRDPTEVMEMQLPTWAHSMGHEDTLVPHPAHGHNPTSSPWPPPHTLCPQGSRGGRTPQPCSPHSCGWHLGLASPLMWPCPPSSTWMRRPTSRTSSTASLSASGSR